MNMMQLKFSLKRVFKSNFVILPKISGFGSNVLVTHDFR